MDQNMIQNGRLEKSKNFFQGKQLLNTKLLLIPEHDCVVSQHTWVQRYYLEDALGKGIKKLVLVKKWSTLVECRDENNPPENSHPKRIRFRWRRFAENVQYYTFTFAPERQFNKTISIRTKRETITLGNLLMGKTFYWKVKAFLADGSEISSEVRRFKTELRSPRWIRVQGATNVRDIGGWESCYGGRIKQGMFFRGSEIDSRHVITPSGRRVLLNDLGIKTDLDIREPEVLQGDYSPLGKDNVFLVNIRLRPYGRIGLPEQKQNYRKTFKVLANKKYYPIYCHCLGGADRTGTLVLLLGGVLGMSKANLIADYELTCCSTYGRSRRSRTSDWFKEFIEYMGNYGNTNDSFAVKAKSYLTSIGVTEDEIKSVRSIFGIKNHL